jgi:hypothetical protein
MHFKHISLLDNSNTAGKNNIITFVLIQFTPNNNQNGSGCSWCAYVISIKKEYHDRNTIHVAHDTVRLILAPCFLLNIPVLVNPFQPSDAKWRHTFHLSLTCMSFAH